MSTGHVEAVCISSRKGVVKHEVEQAVIEQEWGIHGDAHAGVWHRQVSLLAFESIAGMKKVLPQLRNGAFAENIITRGLDLGHLKIGDVLTIEGGIVLEVTQIGKECHNGGCAIKKATGKCIMPTEGIFTRVKAGGVLRKGAVIGRHGDFPATTASQPGSTEVIG